MDDTPRYPAPVTDIDALPKNYEGRERERFWQQYWLDAGVYRFEPVAQPSVAVEDTQAGTPVPPRDEIFSIDTPPPTVSGALHIGHVYSYTQTDMNARYRRMTGKRVFYPFGFDDNGLPTERLVEKERGIRAHEVSREEFIAMCQEVSKRYEDEFVALWQSLALSCDWDQFYTTIDDRSRAISQASFIDLYNKGFIYRKVAPTQWDWVNQTAIAQAEIEDREVPGHFHFIKFQWADGPGAPVRGEFVIGTTRPELIPACVAVMANPESDAPLRDHEGNALTDLAGNPVLQRDLIGKIAITPLFEVEVPILPSEKADPEKGTGVLMCCTFGDMDDVEHWQQFNLPTRVMVDHDGRMNDLAGDSLLEPFASVEEVAKDPTLQGDTGFVEEEIGIPSRDPERALFFAKELRGNKVKRAREQVVDFLKDFDLLTQLQPITHTVRHAERGDVPVEILVTPQWYVNLLDHKQALLEQGRKISWHPEFMRKRYEQWVEGLNTDWCISRQRYNGVPFPLWYRVNDGNKVWLADHSQLPVNPLVDQPFAWQGEPNASGDPDVMDTWATSSVTPLLNTHLMPGTEPTARHGMLFPFDMRAQAHDIIRTWAFYTIVKSLYHFGTEYDEASGKWVISSDEAKLRAALPWRDIVISGHGQTAGREKISKSKGHSVTPAEMVEKYSADGLRFWSGSARLGADTVYDEKSLAEGRKLINKLFNATKFALRHLLDYSPGGTGAPAGGKEPDTSLGAHARAVEQLDSIATGDGARATDLSGQITYPTDLWLLSRLDATIERATRANEAFEFGEAKQAVEEFFWADLCDNYLELSKGRLYGEPLAVEAHSGAGVPAREIGGHGGPPHYSAEELRISAQATLYTAFSAVLRMFAPVLPHITEECWSWYFARFSDKPSIHLESWPAANSVADEGRGGPQRPPAESMAAAVGGHYPAASLLLSTIAAVRKWKSERGVSIKTPLASVAIHSTATDAKFSAEDLAAILGDLLSTANAQSAELIDGPPPEGAVTTDRNPVAVNCELAEQAE